MKDVEEEHHRVEWRYRPSDPGADHYGDLTVEYNENMENIADQQVPWRRAFSQVDCQHRLGHMGQSDKLVTFCIFTDLTRRDEAIIFKTINEKQKKIDTSLVDAIVLLTEQNPLPYIRWAWDLGMDAGSAFNKRVATGGRNLEPPARLVTLRSLRACTQLTVPKGTLARGGHELGYQFLRNYWNVIHKLWPNEFADPRDYKLTTIAGLRGLSRFGRSIFSDGLDAQNMTSERIEAVFNGNSRALDWSNRGQLREASGKAGERLIYETLCAAYGRAS